MKLQRQTGITMGWLMASAIVLGSAAVGAADIGKAHSDGRSVNEVYGRASASPLSNSAGQPLQTGSPIASEVFGRGNAIHAKAGGPAVRTAATHVGNVYGRGAGNSAVATKVISESKTAALSK